TYPFVAILVGWAFLGSSVSVLDVAGGVLIVLGLREVVKNSENSKSGSINLKVLAMSGSTAFLWGINTVVLKYLTSLSDPLILALFRSGLATAFMLPLVLAHKRTLNSLRHAAAALGAGFTSDTLGVILFLISLQLGELSTASILTSTSPLFSAFLSQVFLKEKPPKNRWRGIALIVTGIALVSA
ncbi:MAG TPA: EamA family transporter, partial [Thermofilum sp.]|nr:EamA family transporter [Thermofilum sp.]